MLVYGAGYEGFRVARRPGGEDLEVVVRHPAGLEVVRRRKKAKTDRIDARGMVRAPPARDGGDRDAMSPVRIPAVAEEEGRRLPPGRGRLVRERRRLANAVAGLLRLHGIPPGDPARGGYRARPGGMRTACGTGLPPGLLAETAGIPGRLELVVTELRTVEADRVATPGRHGRRPGRRRPPHPPGRHGRRRRRPEPRRRRSRRTPATRRCRAGCGGSARTTRCCRGPGCPAGTCATGAGRPVPPGRGRCRGRAAPWTTPGARQGRQPGAAKASGADGLALAAAPAAERAVEVVRALRQRPRRASGQARDRGAGAQAAGGAGAVRHDRAGARGRRPVEGAGAGGGEHRTPDTRAARRPPGEPGQGV